MLRSCCNICTDPLAENLTACPCGHVYHDDCLQRWHSRSKTCPICRKACSKSTCVRLFFDDSGSTQEPSDSESLSTLQSKLRSQIAINEEKELKNHNLKQECADLNGKIEDIKEELDNTKAKLGTALSVRDALRKQVGFLTENAKQCEKIREELNCAKRELALCQRVKTMITETHEEAENMLKNIGSGPKITAELASQLTIMKRENDKMREVKKKALSEKETLKRDFFNMQHKLKAAEWKNAESIKETQALKEQLTDAEREKQSLKKKIDKLQQSFQSPSPRSSIINRLLQESPAPLLSHETDENVEFTTNCDSQDRSSEISTIPKTTDPVVTTKSVEFRSPVHPGQLRIKRKRLNPRMNTNPGTGRIRKGYNGLGSQSTVLMPLPAAERAKKVSKPVTISKFVRNISDPPLPQL